MTLLLNWTLQVTVTLSIALLTLTLPLLRKKSAALRHCILSTAIVFSILTPAFDLVIPASDWSAIVPIREKISAVTLPAARVGAEPQNFHDAPAADAAVSQRLASWRAVIDWSQLSLMIWASGVVAGLIVLFTGLVRLGRVVSASIPVCSGPWRRLTALISEEYGLKSIVHLLESRNASILVTFGTLRPRVVLPAGASDWAEERARIVLRHELAHVRRRDWIAQMLAQVLRIVFWFNPLVWIVCRRLRLESECACDDAVLSDHTQGHEYAEHLLDLARVLNRNGQSWSAAVSMARPSTLERRFSAMLNPRLNRYPVSRLSFLSMALLGLVLTVFLSAASTGTPAPAGAPGAQQPLTFPSVQQPLTPPAAEQPTSRERITKEEFFAQPAPQSQAPQRSRGSGLDRALYETAEDGDIADIENLLRAGANVNAAIQGDGTPIMGAARKGHIEAVQLLLDRGADPNIAVSGDGNALIVASAAGHIDIVRMLLKRGANPNTAVIGDGNPLIMAAREGHANIVTLLLDQGANIDQVVSGDENALISASGAGRLNVVRLLVERRADINARVWVEPNRWRTDGEWRTALSEARRYGHQDVVQYLMSVGARD